MERNDELTINNFLNMLYESTNNGQRFCFILGAGASVESGIPSGLEFSRRWLEELNRDYSKDELIGIMKLLEINNLDLDAKVQSENYFDIYDLRFYPEYKNGYAALEEVMENAEPSYGYYPLAAHLANTNNNLVITTNFDCLVEDALFICTHKKPFVVAHESLAKFLTLDIKRPIIAKIHRGLFLEPKNRREQLKQMDAEWMKTLGDEFKIYTPIVIGYGGGDNTLMELLEAEDTNIKNIYWCYRGEKPTGRIKAIVDKRKGHFVKIGGFDEFMYLLKEKFGHEDPTAFMDNIHNGRKKSFYEREKELHDRLKVVKQSTKEQVSIVQKIEGDWKGELKVLTEEIHAAPKGAQGYLERGRINFKLGNLAEAIADYNEAIKLNPVEAELYKCRGDANFKLGNLTEAVTDYSEAIKLRPVDVTLYKRRGDVRRKLYRSGSAIEDYSEAIRLRPTEPDFYKCRGDANFKLGNLNKAIADYSQAIKLNPVEPDFYKCRGDANFKLENLNETIADYSQAIKLNPVEPDFYKCRGDVNFKLGNLTEAIADYSQAIENDPEVMEYYEARAKIYEMRGESGMLSKDLEQIKRLRKQGWKKPIDV